MLLKDFIIETTAEHRALFSLADLVLQDYRKNPRREVKLNSKELTSISEPSLLSLVDIIKIKFDPRFDTSMYNPRTKEVLIKLEDDLPKIKSLLVHELQHALDDLKSQGKFRNEKGEYLVRQTEVNARLSQAIHSIDSALKKYNLKDVDWNDPKIKNIVTKLITSQLKIHNLTTKQGINNTRYQHLISRIYKHIVDTQ